MLAAPRQLTALEQPGYRVTFHTSARPMAGTNCQVCIGTSLRVGLPLYASP